MEYAKQKSKRLFSLKQLVRNHHIKRLDNLLASNELHRIQVPADGDCFFASVLHQLKVKSSVAFFRSKIADHLESIHYINFLAGNESSDDKVDRYMREVSLMREMGHWKSDISDAIPLAVANMQKCQIKIFPSDIRNPVYDITPTFTDFDQTSYINLAYFKVRDEEHYVGVITHLDRSFSHGNQQEETRTPQKPKKAQPEVVTPHKDAVYITPDKKVCTRKIKSNPIMWKRNIRKQNRS